MGKNEKITITNDKGRLTEEQIEKMIKEAEQFADEDKKVKERVDAKNAFDGYIHAMRSATEGSGENKGLSEKMESDEKEQILDALKDGQSWLDSNPEADAEEIKEKHKEIEGICAPIVSKYYGAGGGGGGTGSNSTPSTRGGGTSVDVSSGADPQNSNVANERIGALPGSEGGDTPWWQGKTGEVMASGHKTQVLLNRVRKQFWVKNPRSYLKRKKSRKMDEEKRPISIADGFDLDM